MVEKLHICKKNVNFDQLLDFPILLLLFCAIFNSLNAGLFHTIRVSISLDPDQTRPFVRSDLGPNCLQRLSVDDKSDH